MLVLPLLGVQVEQQLPFAPHYGADIVHDSFTRWQAAPSTNQSEIDRRNSLHKTYVDNLLQMVYYHNWYTGHRRDCPRKDMLCVKEYDNYLFWVGVVTQVDDEQILREKALQCSMTEQEAQRYEEDAKVQNDLYNFGSFPPDVLRTLKQPWEQKCNSENGKVYRMGFSLIKDETPDNGPDDPGVSYAVPCPERLRRVERSKYSARIMTEDESQVWHIGFYFDRRMLSKTEAVFSLCTTVFVCFVLCVASIMFSADAEQLVLHPVEQMIAKVEKIRDSPLMAMRMSDEEFRQEEVRKNKEERQEQGKFKRIRDTLMCTSKQSQSEPMETVVLEKTIIKIGSLLALGFGEAGANIIEENMSGGESAMVTAMVAGEKVDCIVGCARIAEFGVFTEILKGVVMTFVNQVSEIVHGVTDAFAGAPNKNTGSIFYLIWRTSDLDEGYGHKAADMAVFAVTRILGSVHRSPALAQYRAHPGLQQRLKDRPNGCRV